MEGGASVVAPMKEVDNNDDHDHHDLTDKLPPGFRFHPTDEEIISHYLTHKVMNNNFSARAIGEVDLNKCEPWDLPKKAKMEGGKDLYFFWKRDKKYPTGTRTNRATDSGYWKATGKDKEIIIKDKGNKGQKGLCGVVGMKKTLVFYKGRAPKGDKTNWVMHEFRLEGKFSYNFKDEWVVCRVVHKNTGVRTTSSSSNPITTVGGHGMIMRMNSSSSTLLFKDDHDHDDILLDLDSPNNNNNNSLPPLMNMDPPNYHYSEYYKDRPGGCSRLFTDIEEGESKRAAVTIGNDDQYLHYNDQQRLQKQFNLYPDHHHHQHHHHHHHHGIQIHLPTENHHTPIFPFQFAYNHDDDLDYLHHNHHQQRLNNNSTTTTSSCTSSSLNIPNFIGRSAQAAAAASYNIINGNLHDNLPEEERQHYYCKLEQYLPSCNQSSSMVTTLSQDTLDVTTPTTTATTISYKEQEEEDILGEFDPISDLDTLWNRLV